MWYDPPGSKRLYVLLCFGTISMHSMLMLGGSGGMPPQKILKNRCSEIESEGLQSQNVI